MAFDATPGGANSNAYATAAEADAYFLDRDITTWTGTQAKKEAALIRGADYLDRLYVNQWIGIRTNETQAMAWPRSWAVDEDGYSYDADEIPERLKLANYEAALLVLTGTDLEPVLARGGNVTRERVKAASVESETEYSGGAPSRAKVTAIDGLVGPLISGGGSVVELLRV